MERFIIKNYQIIKKGEIELRPGITLITGPSNNGKSSIFKAYKQLIYNLSGNTYINQFADECKLILDSDEYTIEYRKTKTKSSYDIKVVNPETTLHIDKLGVNQIDKVKELTHIDKNLGYNFWNQLEKPFLLCETNREQFLLLQESPISSNLFNIQENIKSDIKILKDSLLVTQGSLNVLNTNITKYEGILQYSERVNKLVDNMKNLSSLNDKITDVNKKIADINNIDKELLKIAELSEIELKVNIDDVYNKYQTFTNKIYNFTSISNEVKKETDAIEKNTNELSKLEEIINTYFNICPLCGNILHEIHNI